MPMGPDPSPADSNGQGGACLWVNQSGWCIERLKLGLAVLKTLTEYVMRWRRQAGRQVTGSIDQTLSLGFEDCRG